MKSFCAILLLVAVATCTAQMTGSPIPRYNFNATNAGKFGNGMSNSMSSSALTVPSYGPPTINQLLYPYDQTAPKDWNEVYCLTTSTCNQYAQYISIEPSTGCICGTGEHCVQVQCSGCLTYKYCYNSGTGLIANSLYAGYATKYSCAPDPGTFIQIDWYGGGAYFYWWTVYCTTAF